RCPVTNAAPDGRFCFDAPAGLHELSVMAVGYAPTRLQVRIEGESSEALVTLHPVSVLESPLAKSGAALDAKDEANLLYSQPTSAKAKAALGHAVVARNGGGLRRGSRRMGQSVAARHRQRRAARGALFGGRGAPPGMADRADFVAGEVGPERLRRLSRRGAGGNPQGPGQPVARRARSLTRESS